MIVVMVIVIKDWIILFVLLLLIKFSILKIFKLFIV